MTNEHDKLRSVATHIVPDRFIEPFELAAAEAYERQARADGAAVERARIVAYLRSEAPASSCRLAMLHVADAIEHGSHAPTEPGAQPEHPPAP